MLRLRPGGLLVGILAVAVLSAAGAAQAQFIRRLPEPTDGQPPRRAPMTLTPTLTLSEEFNDNVFLDNDRKVWDFITGITPGLTFQVERPTYRISLSADATAEIFARESGQSDWLDRAGVLGEAVVRVDPRLTLTASETFIFSRDTFQVATESVSTGRDQSFSNALALGAAFQADQRTVLRAGGSWTAQRYEDEEQIDSDAYRLLAGVDRAFTARLTGIAEYEFDHFAFDRLDDVTTHTPRVGVTYAFTPTLTGSLRAGPTFEVTDGDTRLTPSVIASLRQRTSWGAVGFDYSHLVSTTGGLGGTSRNHSIGGLLEVSRWVRGLLVQVAPLVSIINRVDVDEDIVSFTLPIQATYHLTRTIALVAGYQFFRQRSDASTATSAGAAIAADVDQHRVFVGIQVGYPIRFD